MAEYAPIPNKPQGKKDKSTKQNSPEQLRIQMLDILKKTQRKQLQCNQKEILAFAYGYFKDSKMNIEEYQKFIRTEIKDQKNIFLSMKEDISKVEKRLKNNLEINDWLLDCIFTMRSLSESIFQGVFEKTNELPIFCILNSIAEVHNVYIKAIKNLIENFKRVYMPLSDKKPPPKLTSDFSNLIAAYKGTLNFYETKPQFMEKRKKRYGPDFLLFLDRELGIIEEHFPTLFEHPNYLSNSQMRSHVKKEVESINSVYSILTKELSKIALSRSSLQKEIQTLPSEYQNFFTILGRDSNSLPSSEELVSLNLKHPTQNFFSEKDLQALDKLILNFEDLQQKIFQEKIQIYCKEYITLKSESVKKPQVIEEESFVSEIVSPECCATSTPIEGQQPAVKEGKIVGINKRASSTGTIPKNIRGKELSSKRGSFASHKNWEPAQQLFSFVGLSSIYREKKLSKFHYHPRVSRWIFDPKAALQDPAYKNLTKTIDNQKETLAFHTFPQIIDSLIATNYCKEGEYTDEYGKLIKTYDISGTILIQDIEHKGYFSYTVDFTLGVCFHRCFHPEQKALARDRAFTESQHFSHEELDIQFHPKEQMIQIHDPVHEMKIHLYPPSS